jgi:hypothetical protein
MHPSSRLRRSIVNLAFVTFACVATGCGPSSESTPTPDGSAGQDASPMPADTRLSDPDGPTTSDLAVTDASNTDGPDAAVANDVSTEGGAAGLDVSTHWIDSGDARWDVSTPEAGGPDLDATPSQPETGGQVDEGSVETADAGFVPGPATPIVVNSGPTAQYNQGDGTWKLFYFDAVASQLYAISELSGIVRGYLGTSPSVSPSNYQLATNTDGNLSFTAPATQRYYIAVAASGGGASGSFQVADGGTPIALGSTPLSLTAPDGDNTYFFRFPITQGQAYALTATGPSQPNVSIAVSPRAERSSNGQFSSSIWGLGGSLPFTDEAIPAASVANSYSGFYYFYVRVTADIAITISISQSG